MANSIKSIVSLNSGEMSPLTDSRVDLAKYGSGCRTLENAVAQKYGGATRRPGFWYVGTSKYGAAGYTSRLQAFKISTENNFIIEFGHQFVRFIINKSYVLSGGVPYEIVSPYTALTADAVPEVEALQFCQVNNVAYITHPDHPPYKLTRISDASWTLAAVQFLTPALLDQNVTQITVAANGLSGSVSLVADATAWAGTTHYERLNSVKSGGLLYTCLVDHVSGTFATDLAAGKWRVETIFDPTMSGSTWQLSYLRNASEVDLNITADGTSGTISCLGAWEVRTYGVWSADIAVQRSDDNGTIWQVVRTVTGRADRNADIKGVADTNALYRLVITNYAVPSPAGATTPRVIFEVVDAFLPGLVTITAAADAYHATAMVIQPLYSTNATRYWSEAAWSDYRGYPVAVTAHEQRVIYGGSEYEPQRTWGTYISDIENFDRGDGTDATAGFARDLATMDNSPIRWLASGVDLMVGLSNGEWVVATPDTSQVLSATNIKARQHSDYGSNHVQALMVGDALVFVDRFGLTVRQFMFSIATNKYMSQDLTALADHIGYPGIRRMDVQKQFEKYRVIWMIAGGQLLGLTYDLEHEVIGWHRHVGRPSKDEFLSVACCYGMDVSFGDAVFVAVRRTVGSSTSVFIEQLGDIQWEHASFFDPAPVIWGRSWGGLGGLGGYFQWYGFKRFDWSADGKVADYWLVKTGAGSGDLNQYISTPLTTLIGTVYGLDIGGAIVVNKNTGAVTGNFAANWLYQGTLCEGSSFAYLPPNGVTVEKSSGILGDLIPFYTNTVNGGNTRTYYSESWVGPGYLATYCGNGMWGDGGGTETLSDQMSVQDAAVNGGGVEVPFTGHTRITSYDPNTGIAYGEVSEIYLKTTEPSRTGWIVATITYRKILIAGGPTVEFTEELIFAVGVGGLLDETHVIPMLVGYDVECINVTYQDIGIFMDDGEQLPALSYFGTNVCDYTVDAAWPQSPAFQTNGAGENWDSSEEITDGIYGMLYSGNNWLEQGLLTAFDPAGEFWDDGEGYADGTMEWTFAGEGFLQWGFFLVTDYQQPGDDAESYTDGTITVTDGSPFNWGADGSFQVNDYSPIDDDAETYVDGVLTITDGGDNWLQNGSFQVNT